MEEDVQQPPRKRGRPKKTENTTTFVGFTQASISDEYYVTPAIWIDVCAEIDNLAELKVVQYVMRHTWGYGEYGLSKCISVEEFMHGRKRKDGSYIDSGTGLSESAVKDGIARAVQHEFLTCEVDASDLARIKKYYALKMQEEVQSTTDEEEEIGGFNNSGEGFIKSPKQVYQTPRSKERTLEETYRNRIRNTPPSVNDFENIRYLPAPHERYGKIPDFIKVTLEQFSRDLGDHEHIASNIGQAFRLYEASGGNPDTFMAILDEAKAKARARTNIKKRNSRGDINRMPFFFACLRQDIKQLV